MVFIMKVIEYKSILEKLIDIINYIKLYGIKKV